MSKYLRLGTILDDETETQRLARRAKGYLIHNEKLYHRNASGILQRCIPTEEGKTLLLDIHEGFVSIMSHQEAWLGRLFDKIFIGQWLLATWHRS
jgi:hypothetical protein